MPKVHLLPENVISKIAAGEVIERPASVIKELLENSLDAGANSIEIRLKEAGKTLITIKDNGGGIERGDLENIFLRHATSKIKNLDDLTSIHSLGFRGEALYSIGAIADVVVRSKTREQDSGWEIHLRGGKKIALAPVTMAVGTEIEVKELFFNTPARKKFLKSNTTEMNQILSIVIPYALSQPQCRFLLTHQDKDILDLQVTASVTDRIADVVNLNTKHMLEGRQDFPQINTSLQMIMGDINIKRNRRDMQFIFVNGRPVQNRNLGFHVNQIYRLVFPPNAYPFFTLFINLPADEIDVNMHPTKREVKIRDEQALVSVLRQLCERTLMSHSKAKQVSTATWDEEESQGRNTNDQQPVSMAESFIRESFGAGQASFSGAGPALDENLFGQKQGNLRDKLTGARYIGAFIKKFLFFESGSSLLVIDQHAAQERIIYEQLKKQSEAGNVEVQSLLTPLLVGLTPQEMMCWEESKATLEDGGLTTTRFDKQTIAIHSHPQLLRNPESTVKYFLSEGTLKKFDHNAIARQACRSSVMAGDNMGREQAEYQRDQLLKCADPFTCPHGRPTVIEITESFLDRQFLRT